VFSVVNVWVTQEWRRLPAAPRLARGTPLRAGEGLGVRFLYR
jgi:hypothetical protein